MPTPTHGMMAASREDEIISDRFMRQNVMPRPFDPGQPGARRLKRMCQKITTLNPLTPKNRGFAQTLPLMALLSGMARLSNPSDE